MSRSRFVVPEVVRLSISDGDWIDVKKQLTTGENRKLFARMARDIVPGQGVKLDPEQVGRVKVLAYVIAWSLTDGKNPVPFSEDAIDNLDPDTFREILDAIEQHEEAESKAREKEKNVRVGESNSTPTSPSAA